MKGEEPLQAIKKKTDITTRVTLWAASLKSDIFSTIPGIPGNSPMLGQQNRTKVTHGISQGIYIGVMILHGIDVILKGCTWIELGQYRMI